MFVRDLGRNFANLADAVGAGGIAASLLSRPSGGASANGMAKPATVSSKPVIFASACASEALHGGWKYNGGIKLLNNLVKLARLHGYEAYMVTYDGTRETWLVDHQPHLSMEAFREKMRATADVRCVTSWAEGAAFISQCPRVYFWDMELAWTEHFHFPALARLYRANLRKVAGISGTVQAWHMAHFDKPCITLPLLIDDAIWYPIESERHPLRVGYMDEGRLTPGYIEIIRKATASAGLDLDFFLLRGPESDILSGLRSCQVFLGMNVGKDPLWGEGCPLSTLESISAGAVLVAFDTLGNREIIQSGFNGVLVPTKRPDLMAQSLTHIFQKPGEMERLRENAELLRKTSQTMEARWPIVAEFLELAG